MAGAQKIRQACESENTHGHGETRIPQDTIVSDDVWRKKRADGEPSRQTDAASEPEQAEAASAGAEQRPQHHQRERIVRNEQQQLVNLRRERSVADAEVSVQSAHRKAQVVIRMPRVGEETWLIHEPRNVARPEGDDHERDPQEEWRREVAAE